MRYVCTLATAVVIVGMSISAASAATVSAVQGKVSVSTGGGFVVVPPGSASNAGAGAKVMTGKGATAQIIYEGCIIEVPEGSVVTVEAAAPCAGAGGLGALGGTTGAVIVGGVVIGGVVAAVAASNDDGNDKPASP